MADEMTSRERLLMDYFYEVSKSATMKAAGFDPEKVVRAFFACVQEDVPAVIHRALGRAEVPARFFAQGVAATVLAGKVPDPVATHVGGIADVLVSEGFKWLGDKVRGLDKGAGKKR